MTKLQMKNLIREGLDKQIALCKERIESMREQSSHPQVALMIEKNKGYMMACEDVIETMLYKLR